MPDERFEKAPVDARPWHQRSPYAGVKQDPNERWVSGRRKTQGVNYTFTAEAMEVFHHGRMCGECHDWQRVKAWPERCVTCGANFQEAHDRFLRRFQGEEWVGTTINWREEMDRLDGELERDNWEANPTTGIVLPRGVTL